MGVYTKVKELLGDSFEDTRLLIESWGEFRAILEAGRKDWTSVQIEYMYNFLREKEYRELVTGLKNPRTTNIKAVSVFLSSPTEELERAEVISEHPSKDEIMEILVCIRSIVNNDMFHIKEELLTEGL